MSSSSHRPSQSLTQSQPQPQTQCQPQPQSQSRSQCKSQPSHPAKSEHKLSESKTQTTTKARPTTKRRKVAKACLFCKRSHMTCDDSRPCTRCLKRDIGHLCCDEPPSAVQRTGLISSLGPCPPSTPQPTRPQPLTPSHQNLQPPSESVSVSIGKAPPTLLDLPPEANSLHSPIDPFINPINSISSLFSPSPSHSPHNHPFDPFTLSAFLRASNGLQSFEEIGTTNDAPDHVENALFESNRMTPESRGEEPLIDLNEFLNAYPDLCAHSGDHQNLVSSNGMLDQDTVSPGAIHRDQLLSGSNEPSFSHHSFLDPPPHPQAPEQKQDRLEQIIRSSGLVAFDYSQSEKEITEWIDSKLQEPSKGKMLALWQESQNLLSTIAHQKNPEDLLESEYQFKRNLIMYSPILDTLPIPGCIWRRTGEIYKTNEQFHNLIGMRFFACRSILSFLNHKNNSDFIKIHQLWDVDSCLNFAEKFNRIALDEGQKAVLTSCVLYRFKEKENFQTGKETEKKLTFLSSPSPSSTPEEKEKEGESQQLKQGNTHQPEDQINEQEISTRASLCNTDDKAHELDCSGKSMVVCDRINCSFSFTICRDSFGLPCLIIGNFLPS